MSDTSVRDCICCQIETDCINGLCEMCSDYNYKLQKQSDLLTFGLLREKQKTTELQSEIERLETLKKLAQKDLHCALYEKMPPLVKRCITDAQRRLK